MSKVLRGTTNYLNGKVAETQVEDFYTSQGYRCVGKRWRGTFGEIDLICERQGTLRFIEVKSSHTRAKAANSLSPAQEGRLIATAEQYIATLDTVPDCQFDVALVTPNAPINILENAIQAA